MTITGTLRQVAAVAALLLLAGCAEQGGGTAAPSSSPVPEDGPAPAAEGLVLQVEQVGGFVTPEMLASRLPQVSVYADGRVITPGPVPAIHPGPALPNLQVQTVDDDVLQALVDRALAAGVSDSADLGTPPLADVPSTRFTLVTEDETHVREVYALTEYALPGGPGGEDGPDSGLTEEQVAARADLQEFLDVATSPTAAFGQDAVSEAEPFRAEAVAGIVTPWAPAADEQLVPEPQPWPGPALPGEPLTGGRLEVYCLTATGEQAQAVLDAADSANTLTPWVSADDRRWSVAFRPLLPHESGCSDLQES